jgi:hypothetical protein
LPAAGLKTLFVALQYSIVISLCSAYNEGRGRDGAAQFKALQPVKEKSRVSIIRFAGKNGAMRN